MAECLSRAKLRKGSASVPCCTVIALFLVFSAQIFFAGPLPGQIQNQGQAHSAASAGGLRGQVTDPTGAEVNGATVTVSSSAGQVQSSKSSAAGSYEFRGLAPGSYTLNVTAPGFAPFTTQDVSVPSGRTQTLDVALTLAVQQQEVNVTDQPHVDISPDNNASALVIKGKDLEALSDDPNELQDELNALAGPAAGPNGGQIYIDGFTGGQLPPKSSIREIRVNQNPFSAEFDKLGYGRIEILTKPGTDKLHGSLLVNGNDSAFNSLNPLVTSEPPYYSDFLLGNISGSINKNASYFVSGFRRDNQTNSISNPVLPDGSQTGLAVSNPQSRLDLSPRVDYQLTPTNTLTVRYMYDRVKQTNDGVTQFALESQAFNELNQENTLQISDTQVLGTHFVNETRFQYIRDRNLQEAQDTTATISVQGAFTGGGNSSGTVRDNQDHYELQNYTTGSVGNHSLRFGTRLRTLRDSNYSTSGFNGTFIYPSLADYNLGKPSEYDITQVGQGGTPTARVTLFDAGVFVQDDWRVRPSLTLSYGLRFESQNRISDHADFAPRVGVAWAVDGHGKTPAKTVVRAGYGVFYDRFQYNYVIQAIHENGINQLSYVVKNPDFTTPPSQFPPSGASSTPTVYNLQPSLRAPINMQGAVGVERQLTKVATVSVTYINSRGVHQLYSDNINAPLPGTYEANDPIRPNGINENIYQFQSGGIYKQNQFIANFSVRGKRVSLFGFYLRNAVNSDTSGATYFPSDQFDPSVDYGRSSFDVPNRFVLGGNIRAPYGVSFSPFLVYNSGSPFNITIGKDLNGDNQYNDRPAYATSATDPSNLVSTRYGNFDIAPAYAEKRIPYDLGTGPDLFTMNLRVSRSFGLGPKLAAGAAAPSGPRGPGGGGPGGGGPGGGLGPGGLSGNAGGPPRFDAPVPRRYNLTFTAMGRNIFNNVNFSPPVGVLLSPAFDKSNALAGGVFSSQSSNRSIDLQAIFSF